MPEIGQVLQRFLAPVVIQKVGDDDQQPALWISGNKFPYRLIEAGASLRPQLGQVVHNGGESVPAAATKKPFAQSIAERLDADRVQPDQRHITQRGGQLTRIFEFL